MNADIKHRLTDQTETNTSDECALKRKTLQIMWHYLIQMKYNHDTLNSKLNICDLKLNLQKSLQNIWNVLQEAFGLITWNTINMRHISLHIIPIKRVPGYMNTSTTVSTFLNNPYMILKTYGLAALAVLHVFPLPIHMKVIYRLTSNFLICVWCRTTLS
jgi:hypothetical protein